MIFELFGCIWDCLVAFQYSVQNGSNWCNSSCHKVVLEFFTMNAPHPPHWTLNSCVSCFLYYLGAFGTVWLPSNTQCKTGQTCAKVRAMKSRWSFSNEHTRSTPLDPKLMLWCVSYYLVVFGTVWLRNNT